MVNAPAYPCPRIRRNALLAFVALLMGTAPIARGQTLKPDNRGLFLQTVNQLRTRNPRCGGTRLPATGNLQWSPTLAGVASRHAQQMQRLGFFAHKDPYGRKTGDRVQSAGYRWGYVAENIAKNAGTLRDVVSGWLGSLGHCRNLMSPNATEVGVGRSGDYWVAVMARPR